MDGMRKILITLEIKIEGIPKIIASYILTKNEWEPIKIHLQKNNINFIIDDMDFCNEKIFINNNNLTIIENTNRKEIEAFEILYKNNFFTYDLLMMIKEQMDKPEQKIEDIFGMDEDNENVDYYLTTKKNTPEFSFLDDEKIRKMIMETKKTVDLFKNN